MTTEIGVISLAELHRLVGEMEQEIDHLDDLARWCAELIVGGSQLLTCGNGGSAAEAQHFATELMGRYSRDRRPLPAVALGADGSLLTCIGNDYSFEDVFARQVRGLGRPGDLLVAFSTSGTSLNVLRAVMTAKDLELRTVALLGKDGGQLRGNADREWIVPSACTARIQEAHLFFIHLVCEHIEARMDRDAKAIAEMAALIPNSVR